MNDPFEQQLEMQKQADDSQPGFKVSFVNPNTIYRITITDGTIPNITIQKAIPYDHVYLIGGPVNTHNPNWLLSDALELEKDPSNPFVFYYRGFLKYNSFGDERGAIKFLTSNSAWDPAFHPAGSSNVALAEASKMRVGGADTKWEIPADGSRNGYYVIKLNTLDETINVEQFEYTNVNYPNNVFIAGDAMPCGWDNSAPETMVATNFAEGKYSWTGEVVPGQFKFLKTKGSWGSCYVATANDQPIEYGKALPIVYEFEYYNNGGNDFKFLISEPARCTIDVDLLNMQMSVKKETQSSIEHTKASNDVIISANSGKVSVKSSSSFAKTIDIFSMVGARIFGSSFVLNAEIVLPKGCYVVKVTDTKGQENIQKIVI
jgi:hypothetical protein